MNPKSPRLQFPPGFPIEPGGGGQLRLPVPLVLQKKNLGLEGACACPVVQSHPPVPIGGL